MPNEQLNPIILVNTNMERRGCFQCVNESSVLSSFFLIEDGVLLISVYTWLPH